MNILHKDNFVDDQYVITRRCCINETLWVIHEHSHSFTKLLCLRSGQKHVPVEFHSLFYNAAVCVGGAVVIAVHKQLRYRSIRIHLTTGLEYIGT